RGQEGRRGGAGVGLGHGGGHCSPPGVEALRVSSHWLLTWYCRRTKLSRGSGAKGDGGGKEVGCVARISLAHKAFHPTLDTPSRNMVKPHGSAALARRTGSSGPDQGKGYSAGTEGGKRNVRDRKSTFVADAGHSGHGHAGHARD